MGQLKISGQGSRWPEKQAMGYLSTRREVHTCFVAKEKTSRSSSLRGVTCAAFFALVTCDPQLGQAYIAPRVPRQGLLRVESAHRNVKVIQHVYHVLSPQNRWFGVSRSPQLQFLSDHTCNPQLSPKPPPQLVLRMRVHSRSNGVYIYIYIVSTVLLRMISFGSYG